MEWARKDWILFGLVVIFVLLILSKAVSSFASATFTPDMTEEQALSLFNSTTDKIGTETSQQLEAAMLKNDLAAAKKIGDEGHAAIQKLQDDYHNWLRSKGKRVDV